jgi:hypothetical protein
MLRRAVMSQTVGMLAVALSAGALASGAQNLHSFAGGADGAYPVGGLALGANGVLYGTTTIGGDPSNCTNPQGCGTVYQLTPPSKPGGSWSETVIYAYPSVNGGYAYPLSAPTVGPSGELYVTSYFGGPGFVGDVSEFTPPASPGGMWNRTELYGFDYPTGDPQNPAASVVIGANGVLYGTVQFAGNSTNCGGVYGMTYGCGGVYSLTPPSTPGGTWTAQTIYTFQGGGDGAVPITALVAGPNGVLYGSTNEGGKGARCVDNTVERAYFVGGSSNCGTVFELDPPATAGGDWTETVLYNFEGLRDGGFPNALTYRNGKLYGTATFGGDPKNCGGAGCGGVFELRPPAIPGGEWTEKVIYNFTSGSDGLFPEAGVTFGADGTIFGTTLDGGDSNACPANPGCGIVYQLKPPFFPGLAWRESVLHRFSGADGATPTGGVTIGADGALYGPTEYGGTSATCAGCGTVFRVNPKLWQGEQKPKASTNAFPDFLAKSGAPWRVK